MAPTDVGDYRADCNVRRLRRERGGAFFERLANVAFWQCNCEIRAVAVLAGDGYLAVVGFDDGFDEAEAEAEAAFGTAFVAAIEAGPDFVLLLGRNADAGIAKMHDRVSRPFLCGNFHAAASR